LLASQVVLIVPFDAYYYLFWRTGSLIAPAMIGAISDSLHSLRLGMQLIWLATALSGITWGAGALLLPSLPLMESASDQVTKAGSAALEPSVSFKNVFCGCFSCCPSAAKVDVEVSQMSSPTDAMKA
jgi:hypothetical protein